MITDPLKILRHHQEVQHHLTTIRVLRDEFDDFLFDFVKHVIHDIIRFLHTLCKCEVLLNEGLDGPRHHAHRRAGHILDSNRRLHTVLILAIEILCDIGDIRALITDPLEIRNHLQCRADVAKIPRYRLLLQ